MRTTRLGFIVFSAITLITQQAFGQAPVHIKGTFVPALENTPLSVYKPVAGYFNVFYADNQSETSIVNGTFEVNLSLDKAGFVRLLSKGMPKTYFYAEPGDTIEVHFVRDSAGATKTIYLGSHAGANNLLADPKLLTPRLNSGQVAEMIQSTVSVEKSMAELDEAVQACIRPLQRLLAEGQISRSCYEAFAREIEQKVLSWAGSYLRDYFQQAGAQKGKSEWLAQLAKELFERYDPYSSPNRVATTNYSNSHTKSILREKGVLPAPRPQVPHWAPWDKKFGMVATQVGALDYAPDEAQLFFLGNALLTASVFNAMSTEDFLQVFNVYYSRFPRSPYIPLLTAYLAAKDGASGEADAFSFSLFRLEEKDRQLVKQPFPGVDTLTTFQALIKNHFSGSPVFVDFWATWCSPCIAEFNHEPLLRKFLEERGVKVLYVSVDNGRAAENWKKSVQQYALAGYHYLASQPVQDHLNKWFWGIPRYMLFDANGELLHDNLFRPSTGKELFHQISRLLEE